MEKSKMDNDELKDGILGHVVAVDGELKDLS